MIIQSTILLILIVIWYYKRVKRMSQLERSIIPGPQPHLIFGNMSEYNKYGYNQCFERWKQKYGRIFGFYLGAKPFVVITEPDLLKLIQVKYFTNFFHHPHIVPGGVHRNWKFHQLVDRVDAERWKRMRQTMSPWFSSAQLKSMVPIIKLCSEEMLNKLETFAKSGEEFNIYPYFEALTIDTINRCAFGVVSEDPKLLDALRTTLSAKTSEGLASLLLCFPEFSFVINLIRDLYEKVSDFFQLNSYETLWQSVEAIYEKRTEGLAKDQNNNNNNNKNIIDLMLRRMSETKDKSLHKIEIIANIIGIDEGAYESPVSNMGFIVHHLVHYPNIQQRVYEEVERVINIENNGQIDYEVLNCLSFTEAVIWEAFRIYPTDVLFISHSPESDYKYGSITLPKGVDIRVPLFQLHRDPEYWSDPLVFNPERFLGTGKLKSFNEFVFQPFGAGPRLCPGKRFSIIEIKLFLAQILLKYRLIASDKTEPIDGLELDFKQFILSPKNGITLKILPRKL